MMTCHVIVCIQIVFIGFTENKKEMKFETGLAFSVAISL